MNPWSKLRRGLGWGGLSMAVFVVMQLAFMAVMARLLDPGAFGLVATAGIALRFVSYFSQMGIGPAVVQHPRLDDEHLRAALAISLLGSALFASAAIALAGAAETLLSTPGLRPVIQWLAVNLVISAVAAVSMAVLRRQMRFKAITFIEIASYLSGYGIVGIAAALAGWGVSALVAATLTQSLVTLALAYHVARPPLGLSHGAQARRHFLNFGSRYSVLGFLEFIGTNVDMLLISKLFGAAFAGQYNRALLLATLPVQQPAGVLSRALFPVLSSLGESSSRHGLSYQMTTLVVGCYAAVAGAAIHFSAGPVVAVLLGPGWTGSIVLLEILALSVLPYFLSNATGIAFDALGALNLKLRIQVAALIVLAGALYALLPMGIEGIAWAVVIAEWFKLGLNIAAARRLLGLPGRQVALILSCVAICGTAVALATWSTGRTLVADLGAPAQLALQLAATLFAACAASVALRRLLRRLDVMHVAAAASPQLGRWVFGRVMTR